MDLPPALLQFAGSLAAILVLAGLAHWLRLGAAPVLADDAAAIDAAQQAVDGFEPVAVAVDRDGRGALLRDREGRVLLLRPHGSHFAARLLTPLATANEHEGAVLVDTGEARFGSARLRVAEPSAWVQAISEIKGRHDA